jgi:hypothetical protein
MGDTPLHAQLHNSRLGPGRLPRLSGSSRLRRTPPRSRPEGDLVARWYATPPAGPGLASPGAGHDPALVRHAPKGRGTLDPPTPEKSVGADARQRPRRASNRVTDFREDPGSRPGRHPRSGHLRGLAALLTVCQAIEDLPVGARTALPAGRSGPAGSRPAGCVLLPGGPFRDTTPAELRPREA